MLRFAAILFYRFAIQNNFVIHSGCFMEVLNKCTFYVKVMLI